MWEQFYIICFTEFWWVDTMLVQTVAATGTHMTSHTRPWLPPLSYRETKVTDRNKKDIQSGKASKNCQWFHPVRYNVPSATELTTPFTFQGAEMQGDTPASSFSKAVFIWFHAALQHKVSKCTFWAWHLCWLGEARQHPNIHRCSRCKACVQKAECTKRDVPFVHSWELGATLTAAQWEKNKQDQIG